MLTTSQVNVMAAAIAQCAVGQSVCFRWDVDQDTHLPIPENWGKVSDEWNPFRYWHGSNPLLLRSFRRWGLLGNTGTQTEDLGPCVFACKQRHTPFYSYADADDGGDGGYTIMVNNPCVNGGRRYAMKFKMLIGLCPLLPFPWHSGGTIKRPKSANQYRFPSGTCRPL